VRGLNQASALKGGYLDPEVFVRSRPDAYLTPIRTRPLSKDEPDLIPRRLRLRDGVQPRRAKEDLQERITRSERIVPAALQNALMLRDGYLQWVEDVEVMLHGLTDESDALMALQTSRYALIRGISDVSIAASPWALVQAEVRFQKSWLEQLLVDLRERSRRAEAAGGDFAVIDTNIALHYQTPPAIPWNEVIDRSPVRLVVPLRVIEELDARKYHHDSKRAERARSALKEVSEVLKPAGTPGPLRDQVTIEVPVDPGPRDRPADADREILDTCHELRQFSDREVTLVTADTGMRLRAEAEGIRFAAMPDVYAK
jgi:hypothetical protein